MIYIKQDGVTVEDHSRSEDVCVRGGLSFSGRLTPTEAEVLLRGLLIREAHNTKDAVLGAAIDEVLRLVRNR